MHKQRRCPKCESEDVEPDVSELTSYTHGDASTWICNDCGQRGIFPTSENKSKNKETKGKKPILTVENLKTLGIISFFLILLLTLTAHLN